MGDLFGIVSFKEKIHNFGGVTLLETVGVLETNPQLLFFENMPGKAAAAFNGYSDGTLSIHAINIPLSVSFNNVVAFMSFSSAALSNWSGSVQFGLYSLNGSTLSLANSAGIQLNITSTPISWISMVTSATQNISPGGWYFGFNIFTNGVLPHTSASFFGNTSINPGNINPGFFRGRLTASTNAMPASIATSNMDITGADANSQPYIIITT